MSDVADRNFELLQAVYSDLQQVRAITTEMGRSISSIEDHGAAISRDIASIRISAIAIRADLRHLKGRLNLAGS